MSEEKIILKFKALAEQVNGEKIFRVQSNTDQSEAKSEKTKMERFISKDKRSKCFKVV